MAEEHEGRPDWVFSIGDEPAPLSEEVEAALVEAQSAVEAFVKSASIFRDRARDAEAHILVAHAAGVEPAVLADRLGLSHDALERIVRGEQHLVPDTA